MINVIIALEPETVLSKLKKEFKHIIIKAFKGVALEK